MPTEALLPGFGEPAPPTTPPAAAGAFDPAEYVELPGGSWSPRRGRPCECGGRRYDLVEVYPAPRSGRPPWSGLVCRACLDAGRLLVIKRDDAVARLGTLDPASGGLELLDAGELVGRPKGGGA